MGSPGCAVLRVLILFDERVSVFWQDRYTQMMLDIDSLLLSHAKVVGFVLFFKVIPSPPAFLLTFTKLIGQGGQESHKTICGLSVVYLWVPRCAAPACRDRLRGQFNVEC